MRTNAILPDPSNTNPVRVAAALPREDKKTPGNASRDTAAGNDTSWEEYLKEKAKWSGIAAESADKINTDNIGNAKEAIARIENTIKNVSPFIYPQGKNDLYFEAARQSQNLFFFTKEEKYLDQALAYVRAGLQNSDKSRIFDTERPINAEPMYYIPRYFDLKLSEVEIMSLKDRKEALRLADAFSSEMGDKRTKIAQNVDEEFPILGYKNHLKLVRARCLSGSGDPQDLNNAVALCDQVAGWTQKESKNNLFMLSEYGQSKTNFIYDARDNMIYDGLSALLMKGEILMKTGDTDKAIETFRSLLERPEAIDPESGFLDMGMKAVYDLLLLHLTSADKEKTADAMDSVFMNIIESPENIELKVALGLAKKTDRKGLAAYLPNRLNELISAQKYDINKDTSKLPDLDSKITLLIEAMEFADISLSLKSKVLKAYYIMGAPAHKEKPAETLPPLGKGGDLMDSATLAGLIKEGKLDPSMLEKTLRAVADSHTKTYAKDQIFNGLNGWSNYPEFKKICEVSPEIFGFLVQPEFFWDNILIAYNAYAASAMENNKLDSAIDIGEKILNKIEISKELNTIPGKSGFLPSSYWEASHLLTLAKMYSYKTGISPEIVQNAIGKLQKSIVLLAGSGSDYISLASGLITLGELYEMSGKTDKAAKCYAAVKADGINYSEDKISLSVTRDKIMETLGASKQREYITEAEYNEALSGFDNYFAPLAAIKASMIDLKDTSSAINLEKIRSTSIQILSKEGTNQIPREFAAMILADIFAKEGKNDLAGKIYGVLSGEENHIGQKDLPEGLKPEDFVKASIDSVYQHAASRIK